LVGDIHLSDIGSIDWQNQLQHDPCRISNNPCFRLKHPGVPDGSDGSDGTLYPLTEYYMLSVTQAMGYVA
jgi:hypothetical protein